jgi:hypothetical protein
LEYRRNLPHFQPCLLRFGFMARFLSPVVATDVIVGSLGLKQPRIAECVMETIRTGESRSYYELIAFVVVGEMRE